METSRRANHPGESSPGESRFMSTETRAGRTRRAQGISSSSPLTERQADTSKRRRMKCAIQKMSRRGQWLQPCITMEAGSLSHLQYHRLQHQHTCMWCLREDPQCRGMRAWMRKRGITGSCIPLPFNVLPPPSAHVVGDPLIVLSFFIDCEAWLFPVEADCQSCPAQSTWRLLTAIGPTGKE